MNLSRSNLILIEGVGRKMRRWRKSAKRLKGAVKQGNKEVGKQIGAVEREGAREGESKGSFGHRVLGAADAIRDRVFNEQPRRDQLAQLQAKETKRFNKYDKADRERDERKEAKSKIQPRIKQPQTPRPIIQQPTVPRTPKVLKMVRRRSNKV